MREERLRGRRSKRELRVAAPTIGIRASCVRGPVSVVVKLRHATEEGMLPGKLCHRWQGGDGHGAEAIAMTSSSSMSESSTRCVIDGNMKAIHRRVAAPVVNMEASHRRVAALVASMRQRACRRGTLVVKA